MKFNIIYVLITLSYKLIQNGYDITDTALGNAGLNVKPIPEFVFENFKKEIQNINKIMRYRNSDDVVTVIKKYAYENIGTIKKDYECDVKYNLYKAGVLADEEHSYNEYPELYHKISKTELTYYKKKLDNIEDIDVDSDTISENIHEIMNIDSNTKNNAIKHFVTQAQDYLVKHRILQPKKPSSTKIVSDGNVIKNNMHKDLEQKLTKVHKNAKNSVNTHEVLNNSEAAVADAVDVSIIDTDSENVANKLHTKLSKYMSMHRVGQHKIPIAILSTVLGIGTIGGVYYATGSTDALDTIGSDTDTEVLNDTNDTAQRHGVCIATITACTVLLALCTTTAYLMVCKRHTTHSNTLI